MKSMFANLAAAAVILGAGSVSAADHPDLTGVWMAPFRVHSSGAPMGSGVSPWLPASAGDPKEMKLPTLDELSARFDAIVKANQGDPTKGFIPPRTTPPYTPLGEAAAKAIDNKKLEAQELACYPTSVMSRLGGGPIQIVQNDKAVAIMAEGGTPGRTIFLDGRTNANAIPMWNGHSVGHWEGDTLKVETVAIRGGIFQGGGPYQNGMPMSGDAKLTEEYRLTPDGRTLVVRLTFEDPTYYREAYRKIAYLNRAPDVEVTDFTCAEGKDDMIETQFEKHGLAPVTDAARPVRRRAKTR